VLAWFLVAAMALSLIAGIPVPTGVVVGTGVCWAGGHVIYRLLLCGPLRPSSAFTTYRM
jgi:hypothetical protein